MINYYSFFPSENEWDETFKKVNLKNKKLSIGWTRKNTYLMSELEKNEYVSSQYNITGISLTNAVKSLNTFWNFKIGDVVFIRGQASILGIAILISNPYQSSKSLLTSDHYLQIEFTLLSQQSFSITMKDLGSIDNPARSEIIFSGNKHLAVKQLREDVGRKILKVHYNRI